MFCSKCGSQIEEGARFCTSCGAPVEVEQTGINYQYNDASFQTQPQQFTQPDNGASQQFIQPDEGASQQFTQPVNGAYQQYGQQDGDSRQRKEPGQNKLKGIFAGLKNANGKKLAVIIGSVAAGLAFVLILFLVVIPKLTYKKENAILYEADNRLYYLKDVSKPYNAIEVDRLKATDNVPYNAFTEDGKYIYYYTDYDENNNTSTLCRVKTGKLKKNKKNDKYVEDVAKDVRHFEIVQDDVYYLDDNGKLVMEKNAKGNTIAKNVADFAVSDDQKTIYYYTKSKGSDKADIEIGYIDASSGKSVVIEDDIDIVYSFENNGFFVFEKNIEQDEDTSMNAFDLYVADKKQVKKLAEDVNAILDYDAEKGIVYYDYYVLETTHYSDYFTFPDGLEDIKEPTDADAFVEVPESDVLDAVYDEALTAEEKQEFYDGLDFDEDKGYYYVSSWWDDYEYFYDDAAGKWYEVDDDKLSELWDQYNDNESLAYTAESFKEREYTVDRFQVCAAGLNSDEVVLCDNVRNITANAASGIIFYNLVPVDWDKTDYTTLGDKDPYDVINEIYSDNRVYYQISAGEAQELEEEAESIVVNAVDGNKATIILYSDESYGFYYAEISGDRFSKFELLEDDFESAQGTFKSGLLYYIVYDEDYEGTLYKYDGKESTEILEEVDGLVALTKDSEYIYSSNGDLELYDKKGQKKDEIRDVEDYIYIKKDRIIYTSDDELYLYYSPKKQVKIAEDVDSVTSYARQYELTDIDGYLY